MTPIFEGVPIPFVQQFITEQGDFQPNDVMTAALASIPVGPVRRQATHLPHFPRRVGVLSKKIAGGSEPTR